MAKYTNVGGQPGPVFDMRRIAVNSKWPIVYETVGYPRAFTRARRTERTLHSTYMCVRRFGLHPSGRTWYASLWVYPSGSVKVVGVQTESEVMHILIRFKRMLHKCAGIDTIELSEVKCVLMKADFNLGTRLRLSAIFSTFLRSSDLNPEIYNGWRFRLYDDKNLPAMNVFASGKGFVSARSRRGCEQAVRTLVSMLQEHGFIDDGGVWTREQLTPRLLPAQVVPTPKAQWTAPPLEEQRGGAI